jgi:Phosphatase
MARLMDVIGAHVRRLPARDQRWEPGEYTDAELLDGLLQGGVAGVATHPLDNVRRNIKMLIEGDPDKQFGLRGLPGGLSFDQILGLVETAAGEPTDREARYGPVHIAPEPILQRCLRVGDRLSQACAAGSSVVVATGHPVGLALFYMAIQEALAAGGARVLTPARGERWRERRLPHDWFIDYMGGVAVLTDGEEPCHTHWPQAMEHILARERPDLVVADHGFAGAAIEAGVETVSVGDVNDPALLVAEALGRTELVIVMDDHVDPAAYWPCFQAISRGISGGMRRDPQPLESGDSVEAIHRGPAVDRERGR